MIVHVACERMEIVIKSYQAKMIYGELRVWIGEVGRLLRFRYDLACVVHLLD